MTDKSFVTKILKPYAVRMCAVKFTSEEMKILGVKVGDKVEVKKSG
jgi:formylmethanofuran dehydrogenase subunit D